MELGDPTPTERAERCELDAILDKLHNDFTELLGKVEGDGLSQLTAAQTIEFWERFETFRNRLPLIDHLLIVNAQAHDLAGEHCFSSLAMLLTRRLLLSPGEAAARIRAAAAVPQLPSLAAAQRAGEVSTEQVQIVARTMKRLSRLDVDADEVERRLVGNAKELQPKELQRLANQIVAAAEPDKPVNDHTQQDRRHVPLRQRRDGMWQLDGTLTNTVGAQLNALLNPLTRPHSTSIEIDGKTVEITDERSCGQRLHDAVEDVCGRVLQLADRPATGGTPASVIVTITLEELLAKAGLAETTDGTQLGAEELLRIADQAEIWPTIITANGEPLAIGRTRRIATRAQTMALIARERGCSFPGCDHPPEWCDRHHIVEWILGGRTDLDNLTLLCRYHHTHFAQKGWRCRLNADGLPEWIPPTWIDPQQRPQLNARIHRLHTQRQHRKRRTLAAAA